jgi:hypothetical protein
MKKTNILNDKETFKSTIPCILKKITELKKKLLKLSHCFFSKYTCFLLLGMLHFNTWMWEMSWENEFKNNSEKTNILNDKETFLSAKSWIFTSIILWGADNKIISIKRKGQTQQNNHKAVLKLWNYR